MHLNTNTDHCRHLTESGFLICYHRLLERYNAVLCGAWKNRIKGRDFYDYIFYLAKQVPVNLKHLQSRLGNSSALEKNEVFASKILIKMLNKHFETMNFEQVK